MRRIEKLIGRKKVADVKKRKWRDTVSAEKRDEWIEKWEKEGMEKRLMILAIVDYYEWKLLED